MNKKIHRLLQTNYILYFIGMISFSLMSMQHSFLLGAAELAITGLLYIWLQRSQNQKKQKVLKYIDTVSGSLDSAGRSNILNSPLPVMIYDTDSGEIVWANDSFINISPQHDQLFEQKVEEAIPEYEGRWLLEGKSESPKLQRWNERDYRVCGNIVRSGAESDHLLATTYWLDVTEENHLRQSYEDSRPVVAILLLDNYEEITKSTDEATKSVLMAQVDDQLSRWAHMTSGMLCKYDRNRYLFLMEEKDYRTLREDRFSILDKLHEVVTEEGVMATLSIGIGKDVDTLQEAFQHANHAIEMALSRGGDQAVVKNSSDYEFYGGRSKATEKRTKVKSRVMANALGELINDASNVYVMGHRFADMDSLGAAAGVCCIARKRGKKCQIVIDEEHNAVGSVLKALKELPEYQDVFVSGNEAFLRAQGGSLLVVVDTNRPEIVESEQLLDACNCVAVIDHHRRAASYIENAAVNFHEPYASSASELVAELLQYMIQPSDLLKAEACALLAGIVLDTKNFTLSTGGRTFEAAAFLRRAGADTVEVQRLFQSDLKTVSARYDIICQAQLYHGDIAISQMDQAVDRVAAAQAADEMLKLKGVKGAFVLYPQDEAVLISARSMGDVNVQVILENLGGGGGNAMSAGARIEDMEMEETLQKLLEAIDSYFEE